MLGETEVVDIPDNDARQWTLFACPQSGNSACACPLSSPFPSGDRDRQRRGPNSGTDQDLIVGNEPAREDYLNTRWDYTLGQKDDVFCCYVYDNGTMTNPFRGPPGSLSSKRPKASISI